MTETACRCHYGGDFDGQPHLHASVTFTVTQEMVDALSREPKGLDWWEDYLSARPSPDQPESLRREPTEEPHHGD